MNPPPTWYSHDAVCRATGLPRRTLRTLLDDGRISYVQWQARGTRHLTDATLTDLEALGVIVDREALRQSRQSRQDSH